MDYNVSFLGGNVVIVPTLDTSTNIGHKFLALVDKHFPKDHKLRKSSTETPSRSVIAA